MVNLHGKIIIIHINIEDGTIFKLEPVGSFFDYQTTSRVSNTHIMTSTFSLTGRQRRKGEEKRGKWRKENERVRVGREEEGEEKEREV